MRAVVAGVRQLGPVGNAATAVGNGRIDDTKQRDGRLGGRHAGRAQYGDDDYRFVHWVMFPGVAH